VALKHRVLLYGRDHVLLELRGKVLALSGFETTVTNHFHEVQDLVREQAFDLLILCQTLSDHDCVAALDVAKSQPKMKRLLLTHGSRNLPHSMFDGECNPSKGPECLIEQTALLLSISPHYPAKARQPKP
jgi:DNA-binding NtrC family response regulator